jgi:hypothetical protein
MKDIAEFIRFLTPTLTDKDRYSYISNFHLYLQLFTVFVFFYVKNPIVNVFILCFIAFAIYIEISYKDCPISILEREFHNETWDDILDLIFKFFDWKIARNEKVVGFICFNIGIFIAFFSYTIFRIFS